MVDRITEGDKEVKKQFVQLEPRGRMGEPEEVASAVLWLCSEESSFIAGHPMSVDGGFVAR